MIKNNQKIIYTASALVLSTVMLSGNAVAQNANFDEIIVTARKQAESLLEVPVAVTAFSEADIENIDLSDINNLANFTPGFQYETFGTQVGRWDNSPTFRAVTTNSAEPTRQTASVFLDGIYITNGVQGINFDDVERIEAIKGPQSAVFGRATFGGALNFITKTPGDEMAAKLSATAATRGLYEVGGSVEGPIAGDWLKGRISANLRDKQGHYRSTFDGGRVGSEQTWSVAGTAFVEVGSNFDAKLRASYADIEDGPVATSIVGQNFLNCGPSALVGDPRFPALTSGGPLSGNTGTAPFFCGELPVPASNNVTVVSDNIRDRLLAGETINGTRRTEYGLDRDSINLSAQFNLRFDNGMELSSLTGYNEDEVNQLRPGEFNTADTPAFYGSGARQFTDFSQEVRLAGNALEDALSWSFGINYVEQELLENSAFGLFSSGFLFNRNGAALNDRGGSTLGFFGNLAYSFNDQLALSLEGRYQEDRVEDASSVDTSNPVELKETFTNFLPRAVLEYTPSDDTLVYLSYSEGNLPGGFNRGFAARSVADQARILAVQPFSSETNDEESLKNYEIGVKQRFDRGSISAAAYYMDRTGQVTRDTVQVRLAADIASGDPDQITFVTQNINVGSSEVFGLELEGSYLVNDNLSFDGTLAYIESEFKQFRSTTALEIFGNDSVEGNSSARFPKLSGSLSWTYEDELNADWDWYVRNDNTYNGKRYASEVNLAYAPPSFVSNARIGISNDSYRLEAFVTNLTDEDSPTAAVRSTDLAAGRARNVGRSSPFAFYQGLRDKRQFGVRVTANY